MVRRALVLSALALPLVLLHCASPTAYGTTDDSALVAADDAGDAGDAGDAQHDAGDGGDAGDASAAAAEDGGEVDAAPPPPKKPTKPVTPGDGGAVDDDDASTTDPSSLYPDPSTVHLGALPGGSGGCASTPAPPGTTGLLAAPFLAMIALGALLRKRS